MYAQSSTVLWVKSSTALPNRSMLLMKPWFGDPVPSLSFYLGMDGESLAMFVGPEELANAYVITHVEREALTSYDLL